MKGQWHPLRWLAWGTVLAVLLPVHIIVYALSVMLAFIPINPTRVGMGNLRSRLGVGPLQSRLILSCVYFNYYMYALEAGLLWPLGLEKIEGEAELVRYLDGLRQKFGLGEDRGFLVLGAHFANIESAGAAFTRALRAVSTRDHVVLAKPAAALWMTKLLHAYRSRRGLCLLWTDRKDLLRVLIDHGRKGDSFCFLVDQKPASGGVFARFFGEWAAFPSAGPDVALRFLCPVVHVTVVRKWPGVFRMEFAEGENSHLRIAQPMPHEVVGSGTRYNCAEIHTGNLSPKEARTAAVMGAFAGWLEVLAREHPSQWFWDYRKWSRKPRAD